MDDTQRRGLLLFDLQSILEPFSKLLSHTIQNCSFQLQQLLDICSLCGRAFNKVDIPMHIYIVRYVYMYINAYYVCVYIAIYIYRQSRTPILFKGNLCTRLVDDSNSICVNSNVSLCLTIP